MSQAEREKILIAGAKKEGEVVWYTTDAPKPTQIVFKAFKKKYPFVKTQFIRAKSRAILDRILTETRAGKYLFDLAKTSTETFNYFSVKVSDINASSHSQKKTAAPRDRRFLLSYVSFAPIRQKIGCLVGKGVSSPWQSGVEE